MKIVIIEDNPVLQKDLETKLLSIDDTVTIQKIISNIKDSVLWLKDNTPDLIFMDIQLEDGMCFEIFDQVSISSPVIFVTSFNDFAIKAFELNGIDYIIKPIEESRLRQSIEKYQGLKNIFSKNLSLENIKNIFNIAPEETSHFPKRLVVYKGESIIPVNIDEIAYLFSEDKTTFLVRVDGKVFSINQTLDALEAILKPDIFFRANRQFILNIHSIQNIITHFSSKLKIVVTPTANKDIIISKDKAHQFKEWLKG